MRCSTTPRRARHSRNSYAPWESAFGCEASRSSPAASTARMTPPEPSPCTPHTPASRSCSTWPLSFRTPPTTSSSWPRNDTSATTWPLWSSKRARNRLIRLCSVPTLTTCSWWSHPSASTLVRLPTRQPPRRQATPTTLRQPPVWSHRTAHRLPRHPLRLWPPPAQSRPLPMLATRQSVARRRATRQSPQQSPLHCVQIPT
mmetsp:Transcript_6078/g.18530  ORF Transcript_6078/g.18530 Transcript_6078/m.18530 type:complete len:201 (-) Transcript_6078:342-944(-)